MTAEPDFRKAASEIPDLLATLPSDEKVISIEIDGQADVVVETWRAWPDRAALPYEEGTLTSWIPGCYGDLIEYKRVKQTREKRLTFP